MPAVAMVTHSSDLRTHAGVYGLSWLMLWSSRGFGRLLAITFVEAIDASCGIDQLLLPGKERVASGTDFDVQVTFASRASLERFAASAGDRDFNVFGVNSWFHLLLRHSQSAAPGRNFQTFYDMWTMRYRQVSKEFSTQRRKDATFRTFGCRRSSFASLRLCVGNSLYSFPKIRRPHNPGCWNLSLRVASARDSNRSRQSQRR